MSMLFQAQMKPTSTYSCTPVRTGLLQRKCACGGTAGILGECEECSKKKRFGLQTKLKVNEPGDLYEQEADRIADQVMEKSVDSDVSSAPASIQGFSRQSNGQSTSAGVDQALSSSGRPLEQVLRQEMEQLFGHDFSRVRVHTDSAAARSAIAVDGEAYTVGSHIVFGDGKFSPATRCGKHLLAHELTHVVQQAGSRWVPNTVPEVTHAADAHEQIATSVGRRVAAGRLAGTIAEMPLSAQHRIARARHAVSADFPDPENCWMTGDRSKMNPKNIVVIFDAALDVPDKGAITATTRIRDKVPGSGQSWAGTDAIRFGRSKGDATGGVDHATNNASKDEFTEYTLAWPADATHVEYDYFTYIKFLAPQQYTFAEIKFSPRVTKSRGVMSDKSLNPTIRLDPCDRITASNSSTKKPPFAAAMPSPVVTKKATP